MRVAVKVIIIFLILLAIAISGFGLFCSIGIISETQFSAWTYSFYDSLGTRAIVATACIFVILISLMIVLFRRKNRIEKSTKILTSRNGAIKISFKAISEMVRSLIMRNENIVSANVRTTREEEGINLLIVVHLKGENSIVDATENIEKDVDEFLNERCGVKVYEIDVLIDKVLRTKE